MATPHQANARKQGKRLMAIMRQRRILNLKRKGEPLIPTQVLQKLQAMHLPKDCQAYQRALCELLSSLRSDHPLGDGTLAAVPVTTAASNTLHGVK